MEMRIDWTSLEVLEDSSECCCSIIMLSIHTYSLFSLGIERMMSKEEKLVGIQAVRIHEPNLGTPTGRSKKVLLDKFSKNGNVDHTSVAACRIHEFEP